MDADKQVYISYAWGGESERIANELDADLKDKGISIIRDKRDLGAADRPRARRHRGHQR